VIAFGEVGVTGTGTDLAIVTYGNGHYLSQAALPQIKAAGVEARVIDLRWLSPLPVESLLAAVQGCKKVLIVDECRRSGGPAEGLMALFAEAGIKASRVVSEDSFIATGPAYAATMPSVESILAGALA
jgi:2-oxoisovalerate dehydrogenase E1 component